MQNFDGQLLIINTLFLYIVTDGEVSDTTEIALIVEQKCCI